MSNCIRTLAAVAAVLSASPAAAANISRSVEVSASADRVWSTVGGFCAIANWHPGIATCRLDGAKPPTRTLRTKDGAIFVERQTQRNDKARLYSYTFLRSPLPVTGYTATIRVTPRGPDASTLSWSGAYTPNVGQEQQAADALLGIYDSGLSAVREAFPDHRRSDQSRGDAVKSGR